ncbi:MAG: hypothetical protein ACI9KE_005571 [Polyangiales bacterium]|jgi:hypothetical protein
MAAIANVYSSRWQSECILESMKKHPFFHTLIISSVGIMDGCVSSHGGPGAGPDAGSLPDVIPREDARDAQTSVDTRPAFDGGPVLDVMVPDAGAEDPDTGREDANMPDAGPDVFAADANTEHRLCEPGWPPTKGIRVCQIIDEEGVAVLRCAYTRGEDMEVDWEPSNRCNAAILGDDELWFGDGDEEVPAEYVACTNVESDACRLVDEGGPLLLVCADATCELTEGLVEGTTSRQ